MLAQRSFPMYASFSGARQHITHQAVDGIKHRTSSAALWLRVDLTQLTAAHSSDLMSSGEKWYRCSIVGVAISEADLSRPWSGNKIGSTSVTTSGGACGPMGREAGASGFCAGTDNGAPIHAIQKWCAVLFCAATPSCHAGD